MEFCSFFNHTGPSLKYCLGSSTNPNLCISKQPLFVCRCECVSTLNLLAFNQSYDTFRSYLAIRQIKNLQVFRLISC